MSSRKKEGYVQRRPPYPQWFIEELAYEEDQIRARNKTLSSSDIVSFVCPEHGLYKSVVYNHIALSTGERRRGCPVCAKACRSNATTIWRKERRPIYPQWFIDELVNEDDKKRALGRDLTYKDKVQFFCKEHGVYTQVVADHINYKTGCKKQGCPKCGRIKLSKSKIERNKQKRPDYPEWFINDLANEDDKQKALLKELTWSDKVEFLCSEHGHYLQRIDAHMDTKTFTKKQGCPKCGRNKQGLNRKKNDAQRRLYPSWFIDELANIHDKERAIKGEVTSSECLEFYCQKHGVYEQTVGNHITIETGEPSCKCPICARQLSCHEKEISDYIKSLGVLIEERNRTCIRNPQTNKLMELDLYVPNMNLAFEYNGSLWHGEKFKKNNDYHLTKFRLCEDKGIHLFSIFDKDWFEHKDKIKSLIKDFVLPKVKVFGRNTVIKQVPLKEAKEFYNTYHLKNNDNSYTISYGLYHKGVLISCMSFSKPKFGKQKGIEWDLSRYCTRFGYVVLGGAKKLFTEFLKEYKPSSIVTYSDNDYFTGNIYRELGFSFVSYTDIPYYWAKDNTFLTRQQCQVKVLKEKYPELYQDSVNEKASNKEDYIMHKLGYYKVYRCGNKKWIWKS